MPITSTAMPVWRPTTRTSGIGLHTGIAVEVVGGEVREDADLRREVGSVVQLEGRDLHCEPLVVVVLQRDVRERATDVPRRLRVDSRLAQEVGHQRGGGRLTVRPRDRDTARA